eukprot:gnl/MRDRNA2_/MRDRNA2_144057_c0_seq1.p1 gnl/MRDRNA2_/MRDRNA2_144057_c0~~gnl/MRDRNA2_/MRDRNA2_144057_c0_seq1.p1  ORF type:complete len:291 (-),score=42.06 gnl/MRDRNA2_/MRDRNA2_144057_c0_seq1:93-965(-)
MAAGPRVGFLGGGMMAEALIGGITAKSVVTPERIFVSDISPDRLSFLSKKYGVNTSPDNNEIVEKSDVILIAVKPQQFGALGQGLSNIKYEPGKVFASIMAGVTVDTLKSTLGKFGDVVRVMPNTPAMVNASAAAYVVGSPLVNPGEKTEKHIQMVEKIFQSIGVCFRVDQEAPYLDAVTGLSGSGPAYVYMMIEAMSDGGVQSGLPRAMAMKLAAQTVMGAAKMVLENYPDVHPGTLKNNVESPGGTTIAGTNHLEQNNFRGSVAGAVKAATARSIELGKKRPLSQMSS